MIEERKAEFKFYCQTLSVRFHIKGKIIPVPQASRILTRAIQVAGRTISPFFRNRMHYLAFAPLFIRSVSPNIPQSSHSILIHSDLAHSSNPISFLSSIVIAQLFFQKEATSYLSKKSILIRSDLGRWCDPGISTSLPFQHTYTLARSLQPGSIITASISFVLLTDTLFVRGQSSAVL